MLTVWLLLVLSLSVTLGTETPILLLDYDKKVNNVMTADVYYKYDPDFEYEVLIVTTTSIETWIALRNCKGTGCATMESAYFVDPLYKCHYPIHYQCQGVGQGMPYVQSLEANYEIPLERIDQVLLAADHLNGRFPTEQGSGVLGLGPICPSSALVVSFDTINHSASYLQNLFRYRFAYFSSSVYQAFYFHREVDEHGTPIPQDNSFHQNGYPGGGTSTKLIPIIKGACTWTFRIASPITIYKSTLPSTSVDEHVDVPRPLTITYDPSNDFNLVSEKMAAEYAKAFIAINDNLQATAVDIGNGNGLVAFKYWQGTSIPPPVVFPALSFTANTTDAANDVNGAVFDDISTEMTLFTFTGFQGVYLERTPIDPDAPDDTGYDYYLPFAFSRQVPGCKHWILGYAALNNGITALTTDYTFPMMVGHGTAKGITKYYIALQ